MAINQLLFFKHFYEKSVGQIFPYPDPATDFSLDTFLLALLALKPNKNIIQEIPPK